MKAEEARKIAIETAKNKKLTNKESDISFELDGIEIHIKPSELPEMFRKCHKNGISNFKSETKEQEITDADKLQEIYDKAEMDVICGSDIYLRGFQDGLDYSNTITNADIEAWVEKEYGEMHGRMSEIQNKALKTAAILGAKALKNGAIKHLK